MENVAVVLIGLTHPHVFSRLTYLNQRNDIDVLGYYEKDEQISQRLQNLANCARYTDLDSLLSLPFQVVVIHGLDHDNALFMQKAINVGAKGIFVEKPGVGQPADFYPIARQISEKSIVFESGWELHHSESMRLARSLIKEGVLGSVTTARFHGGCPAGAGLEMWQSSPLSIGGFLYSIGGHSIETVIDLFGLPTSLVASIRKLPRQQNFMGFSMMPDVFGPKILDPVVAIGSMTYEDIGSAILKYQSFNITLDFTAWEPNGYCEEWAVDIYGTEGALHLTPDPPSGTLLLRKASGPWIKGRNRLFSGDDGSHKLSAAFQAQMDNFFDRVSSNIASEHSSCDENITRDLLMLYEALYKSSESECWVEI